MAFGTCKLTGKHGKLIKSHLLPKTFTKAPGVRALRIEAGMGMPPRRRFDAWYDREIVTRAGEDLLARYDDRGSVELRRLGLVWSSFKEDGSAGLAHLEPIGRERDSDWFYRKIERLDHRAIRLFFLSLLWRAAVTSNLGFLTIQLAPERIELLREMLVAGDPGHYSVFPMSMIQLITKGEWHTASPTRQSKPAEYADDGSVVRETSFFRFYLDGLIIHIEDDDARAENIGKMAVGNSDELVVLATTFKNSAQEERVRGWIQEAEASYPGAVARLLNQQPGR